MSKAKDVIDDIRNKVFERKKQETVEEAKKVIEQTLTTTVYDVIQDPNTNSRQFVIVKIVYNLSKKLEDGTYPASVMEVRPFSDKVVGLSINKEKTNLKYFFERNGVRK